jgi:hypothetical protein
MLLQGLLDTLDSDLKYAIEVEGGMQESDITNLAEVNTVFQATQPLEAHTGKRR